MEVLVKELLKNGRECLEKANISDAINDSWLLAEYILEITKTKFYINPTANVSKEKADIYMSAIKRRAQNIPLQHITEHQEFMGLDFKVNQNVLIPRQDTELLVEMAANYINGCNRSVKVLDMCTGSGCIAISIDKMCPNADVVAADISEKALEIARYNNSLNGSNVTFIKTDMFENIIGKFDVIISNPPYIETETIKTLMPEVREHEPYIALDGDTDGLKFYKIIIENLNRYLKTGGKVFFEIGYNQGKSVPDIFNKYGYYNVQLHRDLSGNDRVVCAGKE